jgi:putative spermidine/putrescine transport system substrate-binding protein
MGRKADELPGPRGAMTGRGADEIAGEDPARQTEETEMTNIIAHRPSRRSLIAGTAAALAAPYVFSRSASAGQEVLVRTPGGSYDEQRRDTIYEPFRKETGIEVVPVASSAGKLVAMFKAGHVDIDVIETGDDIHWLLEDAGALAPVPYDKFKYTNVNDIDPAFRRKFHVGLTVYADVLAFNTTAYAAGKEPQSWAEFWDLARFPGPRGMADMSAGVPNLEFALVADGVAPDKIYPIDIERAFKSLSKIRSSIVKFWTSGAMAAQMISDKETYLTTIWSSRAQAARLAGAAVGIQWNQNLVNLTASAITKDARNMEAAQKYLDYSLSAEVQTRLIKASKDVPVNKKAYSAIAPDLLDPATNMPWTASKGFIKDARWWADNRGKVSDYWAKWILG